MSYATWPTTTHVASAIAPLTMPTYIVVSELLTGLVSEIERYTGYKPFAVEATNSDRRMSTPFSGDDVWFDTGYVSVEDVYLDATTDTNGTEQTLGTDFVLVGDGPYEGIKLFSKRRFAPHSIRVVGKRGFSATIPTDLWEAVLLKAAQPAFTAAMNAASASASGGTVEEVKQGPVTIKFSATSDGSFAGFSGTAEEIEARWQGALMKYQRISPV